MSETTPANPVPPDPNRANQYNADIYRSEMSQDSRRGRHNDPNQADLVTLRELLEQRMDGMERAAAERALASATALIKATSTLEARLESMNEFRAQLNRQAGLFVTRDLLEAMEKTIQAQAETNYQRNAVKIEALQRNVYTILGGLAVLQVVLRFLIQ